MGNEAPLDERLNDLLSENKGKMARIGVPLTDSQYSEYMNAVGKFVASPTERYFLDLYKKSEEYIATNGKLRRSRGDIFGLKIEFKPRELKGQVSLSMEKKYSMGEEYVEKEVNLSLFDTSKEEWNHLYISLSKGLFMIPRNFKDDFQLKWGGFTLSDVARFGFTFQPNNAYIAENFDARSVKYSPVMGRH